MYKSTHAMTIMLLHTYIQICTYIFMHTDMHTYTSACACAYAHTITHVHAHTHTSTLSMLSKYGCLLLVNHLKERITVFLLLLDSVFKRCACQFWLSFFQDQQDKYQFSTEDNVIEYPAPAKF